MDFAKKYTRVLCTLCIAAGLWAVGVGIADAVMPVARAAPDGIPDEGLLDVRRNEKLDEMNANLRGVSEKLGSLVELVKSGKVRVVVVEGAAEPVIKPVAGDER